MNRSTAVIALVAVTAFTMGIVANLWRDRAATLSAATVYPTPRSLPEVRLKDHHGDNLGRERFSGGWDLLFFGFTHCPDICPTTLQALGQLRKQLADLNPSIQPRVWLVSVDPERDTPQVLARYLDHFAAGFSGITGSTDQVTQFAAGFGVAHQRVAEGDDYIVGHTAALFLVDPNANLAALFSAPHDMAKIASDYRVLTR